MSMPPDVLKHEEQEAPLARCLVNDDLADLVPHQRPLVAATPPVASSAPRRTGWARDQAVNGLKGRLTAGRANRLCFVNVEQQDGPDAQGV